MDILRNITFDAGTTLDTNIYMILPNYLRKAFPSFRNSFHDEFLRTESRFYLDCPSQQRIYW